MGVRFLVMVTGSASAATQSGAYANASWIEPTGRSCTGNSRVKCEYKDLDLTKSRSIKHCHDDDNTARDRKLHHGKKGEGPVNIQPDSDRNFPPSGSIFPLEPENHRNQTHHCLLHEPVT